MHQYATLEDTVYFGFATNDTAGSGADGTTPLYDVRLGGGAASDAPILSGTPTLLTHANYSPGCYEVAVAATAANGFAAGSTYLVFVTATVDSQTPAAMVGSFTLAGVPAVLTAASVTTIWAEVITGSTTAVQAMRGFIAAMLGKASGLPLAPKYRNIADSKDVISATTTTDGNRSAVTLDLT